MSNFEDWRASDTVVYLFKVENWIVVQVESSKTDFTQRRKQQQEGQILFGFDNRRAYNI
jgi:hypothetical protein